MQHPPIRTYFTTNRSKRARNIQDETNLLCLFHLDLASAPGDDVQINNRVKDQQKVHGGYREEIDDARYDAPKLLGMEAGCYEEGAGQ